MVGAWSERDRSSVQPDIRAGLRFDAVEHAPVKVRLHELVIAVFPHGVGEQVATGAPAHAAPNERGARASTRECLLIGARSVTSTSTAEATMALATPYFALRRPC